MAMGFSGAVRVAGIASKDQALYGVLAALKEDIAAGKLAVFEELVHANVYGDLLAQGDGLHRDGYHRAAVVVVGAALEEHVRLLAVKNAVPIAHPDGTPKKATALNSELDRRVRGNAASYGRELAEVAQRRSSRQPRLRVSGQGTRAEHRTDDCWRPGIRHRMDAAALAAELNAR